MSEHSVLPPSSAARRMACPGSRALEAMFPSVETEASREGTLAHAVAAEYLRTGVCPPVGDAVTAEMVEGSNLYYETIISDRFKCKQNALLGNLHIEENISISDIHPEMWGTPDAWFFDGNENNLYIYDYKFGHSYVEVFENWQLIAYAKGILKFMDDFNYNNNMFVNFRIVQPRYFGQEGKIREWPLLTLSLKPYFERLRASEHNAMSDPAPCFVSFECKNCRARHVCPTLQTAALDAVDLSRSNVPFIQKPAEVGAELRVLQRAADQLNARITGLETVAESMLLSGKKVDNFMLKRGNGCTKWNRPQDELFALADLFDVDIYKPAAVVTPKQAIAAGLSEAVVEAYTETIPGALKLAPVDTKATRKLFGST